MGTTRSSCFAQVVPLGLSTAQGMALGQFNLLRHMYKRGYGVSQDYVQAHKWLNLASSLSGDVADYSRSKQFERKPGRGDDGFTSLRSPAVMAREWQPKTIGPETGPLDMNTLKKVLDWSLGRDGPAKTAPASTPSTTAS